MRTHPCPICTGSSHELGSLGHLVHFRCESCGMQFHKDASVVEDFEDDSEDLEAFQIGPEILDFEAGHP